MNHEGRDGHVEIVGNKGFVLHGIGTFPVSGLKAWVATSRTGTGGALG